MRSATEALRLFPIDWEEVSTVDTAAVYVRVSTEEQVEKGYSLRAQRDECLGRSRLLGAGETLEFTDEGISGSVLERPGLMALLETLKVRAVRWVICYDSSRLSRSVAHQLLLLEEIAKSGAEMVFVATKFDDTPEDRFQLTVLGAVNEYERAKTRLRSLLGKRTKAKAGKLTHSPGLYGYRFDKETDMLIIVEEQAQVISLMFQWFVSTGRGPLEIARKLNDFGIPSPRGSEWSRQTVRRILSNTAYTGTLYIQRYDARDVKFNRHKRPEDRVKRREKPFEEWLPVTVPAIISRDRWEQAQARLEYSKRRWRQQSKHPYLLSSLLTCGACGSTVHGSLITSRGKKRPYYVCTAKSPGLPGRRKCGSRYMDADSLEDAIWHRVQEWLEGLEPSPKGSSDGFSHSSALEMDVIERELARIPGERDRITTLFQRNLIGEDEACDRLTSIERRLRNLRDSKDRIAKEHISPWPPPEHLFAPGQLAWPLSDLDFDTKRLLVNTFIKQVVVTGDNVEILALAGEAR